MRQARHHTDSGPDEVILDCGKAVLNKAPLWSRHGCVPGIVNIPEGSFQLWGEVVIEPEQFLPPIRRWGNSHVVARHDEVASNVGSVLPTRSRLQPERSIRCWNDTGGQYGEGIPVRATPELGYSIGLGTDPRSRWCFRDGLEYFDHVNKAPPGGQTSLEKLPAHSSLG